MTKNTIMTKVQGNIRQKLRRIRSNGAWLAAIRPVATITVAYQLVLGVDRLARHCRQTSARGSRNSMMKYGWIRQTDRQGIDGQSQPALLPRTRHRSSCCCCALVGPEDADLVGKLNVTSLYAINYGPAVAPISCCGSLYHCVARRLSESSTTACLVRVTSGDCMDLKRIPS